MKAIKDSVHGHVRLGPVAADLLDTPAFQRLRHVKQLSTVRLVFPSANHTRFEHSLGVYHLATRALEGLGLDPDTAAHVRAAALLHDIGHGPYGHQTEEIIRRETGADHDDIGWLVTDPDREVTQVLERHGLDPERVASLVSGEGGVGALVSGELDVDRMDYLVRDAHHTGVPYGSVDVGRLVNELRLLGGTDVSADGGDGSDGGDGGGTRADAAGPADLVLAEGNVATAESLLVARSLMNAVVYRHHVSRVAGAMLERACERLLDSTDRSVQEFRRMADHDLLVALRESVPALGRRIERRICISGPSGSASATCPRGRSTPVTPRSGRPNGRSPTGSGSTRPRSSSTFPAALASRRPPRPSSSTACHNGWRTPRSSSPRCGRPSGDAGGSASTVPTNTSMTSIASPAMCLGSATLGNSFFSPKRDRLALETALAPVPAPRPDERRAVERADDVRVAVPRRPRDVRLARVRAARRV